jgi:alkylated DNA nucleotide flippase Atl1
VSQTEAVAELARKLAVALAEFADEYAEAASGSVEAIVAEDTAADPLDQYLGPRQREIVALANLATTEGLTTGDIHRAIDYEQPNVYLTLQSLERRGIVERVAGARPHRYRLTARYRPTAGPYLELAALVQPGEWTTYGDISIAHRGDTRASRAVGRAASTLSDFPNPHRILREGGIIPSAWHDDEGQGPEECRRRLEAEGIRFTDEGAADLSQRITWDVLVERQKAA